VVCDSKIKGVKYLLEITKDGIEEHELQSRLLLLKNQGKIIGFKNLSKQGQLDAEQIN